MNFGIYGEHDGISGISCCPVFFLILAFSSFSRSRAEFSFHGKEIPMAEPEETGADQLDMEGIKISNFLGGLIIALILSLGGLIVYQSY